MLVRCVDFVGVSIVAVQDCSCHIANLFQIWAPPDGQDFPPTFNWSIMRRRQNFDKLDASLDCCGSMEMTSLES